MRSFASVLGAIAFVAASSILAASFYLLAVWIGWKLPPSLFDSLQQWVPDDKYDLNHVVYRAHRPLTSADFRRSIIQFISEVAFLTQGLALFGAALWIRFAGWPKYWRDFDSSLRRKLFWSACWKSSLCLAVTWFVAELIWVSFDRINHAAEYRFYSVLDLSYPPFLLNWLSIPVIQFLVTAHFLTGVIRQSLAASERKCMQCGHQLTSTVAMTCTECGNLEPWPFVPRFGWLRVFTSRGWNKWGLLLWIVPFLMLMAPVVMIQLRILAHVAQKFLGG